MHEDLRRRALESGKTVSNKSKSKTSSRGSSKANSAANSRAASRIQSRDASDDDEPGNGNLSDETTQSINSIDQLLESDDFNEQSTDILRHQLQNAINDLLERKGSSSKSREDALATYVKCLTSHYMAEGLYGRVNDLLSAFGRSVRVETSEEETILALRAIALTAITYEQPTLYETVSPNLKRAISSSQSMPTKAAAIYSLGACISFGGAGEEEILDVMTFLLEIVLSDGGFISAEDSAEVVAAASNTYGFLATHVEDIEHESEDAVSAFMDQLDSDDVRVQVAAGENIALLFEKSYTPREDDEDTSTEEEEDGADSSDELSGSRNNSGLVKRYNAYHNASEVLEKVNALKSLSTKSMSRRDKKFLHQSFSSIALTIEKPRNGLWTNNASKMTVRIHREGEMQVDKWWKFMRLAAIRRLLGGGFVNHYFEGNKQVLDSLPMIMRATNESGIPNPRKTPAKATKGKFRDNRRFVSGEFLSA